MALTRAQADSMTSQLRLTFEGTDGDLNITYRPNLLSRAEFRRLQEIAERGEDGDDNDAGLAPLLSRVLVGWDFLQDDGQPYPIDGDSLDLLGYPLQVTIVRTMITAVQPDPTKSKASARSSEANRVLPMIESRTGTSLSASDDTLGQTRVG